MNIELIHLLFFFWGFCTAMVICGVMASYRSADSGHTRFKDDSGRIRRIKKSVEVHK